MINRRIMVGGITAGAATFLSSCGTIIYPDRVNQKERGGLDPAIIILDGIGLFFFLIPGVVAFAVDFATGAIFLPVDKEPGDEERTIFDDLSMHPLPAGKLNQRDIEQAVTRHAGVDIDLTRDNVRVMRLEHIDQFQLAYTRFSGNAVLAANY